MKKIAVAACLGLFFAISIAAQQACKRHLEVKGGFSFCPPNAWVPRDPTSGTYKSFFTPENAVTKANLNVKDEASTQSNDEYMASSLRYMLKNNDDKGIEKRSIIGWTTFTTASGLKGCRMVYEAQYKGLELRTVQFVLDLPGRKMLLTGTGLAADKAINDKIFDDVASTIRAEPQ